MYCICYTVLYTRMQQILNKLYLRCKYIIEASLKITVESIFEEFLMNIHFARFSTVTSFIFHVTNMGSKRLIWNIFSIDNLVLRLSKHNYKVLVFLDFFRLNISAKTEHLLIFEKWLTHNSVLWENNLFSIIFSERLRCHRYFFVMLHLILDNSK